MNSYFSSLARYNAWANRRIYAAVGELTPGEIAAPRIGFFPSLLKTLNHLIVADRIWLSRLTAIADPEMKTLDQIVWADFAALATAREGLDARILAVVQAIPDQRLSEILHYKTTAGIAHETPISLVLGHMFNHQTHHRGQAHGMLSGTQIAPPSLDLIAFLREEQTS
nr:DinB family protein [uncultured Dongia sp.]